MTFPDRGELDVPYDQGKPTAARLDDAIAICDSLTVREMTPADLERMFTDPRESGFPSYRPTYPATK